MLAFLCVLGWIAIVAGPILIALLLNKRHQQQVFRNTLDRMGGTLVAQHSDRSLQFRIAFQEFDVSGAYFPALTHWFGRDVLELHFALPTNQAELYFCCACDAARRYPHGWQAVPVNDRSARYLVASTQHPDSHTLLGIGLQVTFKELQRLRQSQYCRVAVDGSTMILLVTGFGASANMQDEMSRLLVLGTQMARQVWVVMDGSLQLSETQSTPLEDQLCPVCSCPVSDPVPCARCRTPHCRDCWEFNHSQCGVFGCGGTASS